MFAYEAFLNKKKVVKALVDVTLCGNKGGADTDKVTFLQRGVRREEVFVRVQKVQHSRRNLQVLKNKKIAF